MAHWPQQRCREKEDHHLSALTSPRWGWDGLQRLPSSRRRRRGCRSSGLPPPSSRPLQRPGRRSPARPHLHELGRSCIVATSLPGHLHDFASFSGRLQRTTRTPHSEPIRHLHSFSTSHSFSTYSQSSPLLNLHSSSQPHLNHREQLSLPHDPTWPIRRHHRHTPASSGSPGSPSLCHGRQLFSTRALWTLDRRGSSFPPGSTSKQAHLRRNTRPSSCRNTRHSRCRNTRPASTVHPARLSRAPDPVSAHHHHHLLGV